MKPYRTLIFIVLVVALATWIAVADEVGFGTWKLDTHTRQGLDLVGGVQVVLEGQPPAGMEPARLKEAMGTARSIIERRVNGLGVSEAVVVLAGDRRIVVELPEAKDPEQAKAIIRQTALLEFVDMSAAPQEQVLQWEATGETIYTDADPSVVPTGTQTTVWHTIMTGAELSSATVVQDPQTSEIQVGFKLHPNGSQIFADFTTAHINQTLAIVLDKKIISAPSIRVPITGGEGVIQGNFTYESANALAVQLSYGALPIELKEVETRTVGPSLGQDSLRKSLIAGAIGFAVVMLFMALYYRLPGVIADVAIIIYAVITFALYRSIPVTLSLPGIAGFLLSTGSALDANILIFERMKEELRDGRTISQAIRQGFDRAWSSIRDSNIATLITCTILLFFGSSQGATIVQGFAVTLLIGILVSLFTAIIVTRTLLTLVLGALKPNHLDKWFGI